MTIVVHISVRNVSRFVIHVFLEIVVRLSLDFYREGEDVGLLSGVGKRERHIENAWVR